MRPRRVTADDRCSLPNERAVLIGEQLFPILAERLSTFMSGESPKSEIPQSQRQVQPAQMHVNTLIRTSSSLPNEDAAGPRLAPAPLPARERISCEPLQLHGNR